MTRIMLIMLGLALAVSCANKQQMALLRSEAGDFGLVYDEGGRLSQITGPDGISTALAHVGARMQSASFGDGSEVEYLYDKRGRLVGVKDPLGGRRIYDFDESGRVVVVQSLPGE